MSLNKNNFELYDLMTYYKHFLLFTVKNVFKARELRKNQE